MFPDRTTLAIVKFCVVAVVLLCLYLWARGTGVEAERKRNETAVAVCQSDRAALVTSLDEVNAAAALARQAEAQQQARADEAIAGAKQDAQGYQARIGSIAAELERAKQQPTCRAQLEQTLCIDLH